jgi:hypothetical protein
MGLLYYSEAVAALSRLYEACPDEKRAEVAQHILKLAINAFTDCVNDQLGFREPHRPLCNCENDLGPDLGREEEFYVAHPLS